jgi:hypothetical protein
MAVSIHFEIRHVEGDKGDKYSEGKRVYIHRHDNNTIFLDFMERVAVRQREV